MVREMKVFENNKVPDYKIFDDKKDFTYIFQKHYSFNPKISSQDDIDRYIIEIYEAYERSKDFEIKAFVLALESWEYF